MSHRYNRTAALVLVGVLLLQLFCGCRQHPSDDTENTVPLSDFTLIRADDADTDVLKQVLKIRSAAKERFNLELTSTTDYWTDNSDNKREILVGLTNRAESKLAYAELEDNYGYIVRNDNGKIVIAASTKQLMEQAVGVFLSDYFGSVKDGKVPDTFNRYRLNCELCIPASPEEHPTVVIPEGASQALEKAAIYFAAFIGTYSGVQTDVSKSDKVTTVMVISSAKDIPENVTLPDDQNAWGYSCVGSALVFAGNNDRTRVTSMARFCESIADYVDYTEDDRQLIGIDRTLSASGSWAISFPYVIGGSYMGYDSFSANGTHYYFERVTSENYLQWLRFFTLSPGYTMVSSDMSKQAYTASASGTEIIVSYDSSSQTLTVTETSMR